MKSKALQHEMPLYWVVLLPQTTDIRTGSGVEVSSFSAVAVQSSREVYLNGANPLAQYFEHNCNEV